MLSSYANTSSLVSLVLHPAFNSSIVEVLIDLPARTTKHIIDDPNVKIDQFLSAFDVLRADLSSKVSVYSVLVSSKTHRDVSHLRKSILAVNSP